MKNWMKKLAAHYEKTRARYPHERLLILFDIDGTIIDTRHIILCILQRYDQMRHTHFFDSLLIEDITIHENHLPTLLEKLGLDQDTYPEIVKWYKDKIWSPEEISEFHKPYEGVMGVIRWFQMQPDTFVGLNTGRPENFRDDTLRALNRLGAEYKVCFTNDLLFMNHRGVDCPIVQCKAEAIIHYKKAGYRIFAMVDNEPENLNAIAQVDPRREILLLHADTIFESKRRQLPPGVVKGKDYDITELIQERALPQHIQFVWHNVNHLGNLIQFLNSNIQWAECYVTMDSRGTNVTVYNGNVEGEKGVSGGAVHFNDILFAIGPSGKSIKVDLRAGGPLIEAVIRSLKRYKIDETRLWFSGKIGVLQEEDFRALKASYPGAILQCSIDTVIPLVMESPNEAASTLSTFRNWGINRFSLKWNRPYLREVLDWLDTLGMDANIYQVPDLESFLKAVLLMPRSITSDFNFPKWNYFGTKCEIENEGPDVTLTHPPSCPPPARGEGMLDTGN